ncbi:MAG TPA: K(+)-transporting ATPase subunit F [Thermoplasmata archaeon]|nr:MAG TPA: K(+)-transporting ATPase subunit F [Thermoplasmata archaeon]
MLLHARGCEGDSMSVDVIIFIIVGITLFLYLLYALLRSEKF